MDIRNLPSEDLAIYVREEDTNAYREIVARYEREIIKLAKLLLGNEILAHEAAQESFIRAFINLHSFSARTNFSVFLYRESIIEIEKIFKQKHVAVDIGTYPSLSEEILEEDNLEYEFSNKNLLTSLALSLPHMPFKDRVPAVLHYFCNKSYDEIVDILQISGTAIAMRIGNARAYAKKHHGKK